MNFVRVSLVLLFVALGILSVAKAITRLNINASNCDAPQKTVIDDARNRHNIISQCNCTIKSNFSGKLIIRTDSTCSRGFYVFDDNGRFNETICYHNKAHFSIPVTKGDKLKLVLMNTSLIQSGNPGNPVEIYASLPGSGLFSVTCGSASDSIRRTTIPILVTGTFEASNKGTLKSLPTRSAINNITSVTETDAYDHNLNASEFPYRYALAAESTVIVVALIIFLFIYIRKIRARNTSKEETKEAITFDNATNGIDRPENVDSNEQQQLPDNPLYQSYQINDDGGYSTCRNIGHSEQLPDDTLYHFYEGNDKMIDSKIEKDRARTPPSKERKAVYAQPYQRSKAR